MKGDFRQLINTPADLAVEHLDWATRNATMPGMSWGIPTVDRYVIPMRSGDLVGIMARPGHGKSSLLAYLARTESKRIIERGTQETEAVVYVTWESSAEEITNFLSELLLLLSEHAPQPFKPRRRFGGSIKIVWDAEKGKEQRICRP